MRAGEVRRQTAQALRGRCWEGQGVVWTCLLLWLFGLFAELMGTWFLQRLHLAPTVLAWGMPLLRLLLGSLLLIPACIGALWWFVQTANGEENPPGTVYRIWTSGALQLRGGRLLVAIWCIGFASWLPVLACGWGAVRLLTAAMQLPEAPLLLALASQLCVLCVVALLLHWRLLLGLLPAAFLFVEHPLRGTGWLLRRSLALMDGRRGLLLRVWLGELLRPRLFLCTRLGVATALFVKYARFDDKA